MLLTCSVCGHSFESEEIPQDYSCPLCGVGKDALVRMPQEGEDNHGTNA